MSLLVYSTGASGGSRLLLTRFTVFTWVVDVDLFKLGALAEARVFYVGPEGAKSSDYRLVLCPLSSTCSSAITSCAVVLLVLHSEFCIPWLPRVSV